MLNSNNPLKRLAGETAIYGMGTIVPRLLNYLLTPFFTRILLRAEYGIITEMYAYAAILLVILTYGMETAFFRYSNLSDNPRKIYNTSITSIIVTSVAFLGILIWVMPDVSLLLGYPNHQEYLLYVGLIVVMDAIASIPFASLRNQKRAFRFSKIKLINVLVNIFFNIYFLWFCPQLAETNPDSAFLSIYNPGISVGYILISNVISSGVTLLLLLPELLKVRLTIDFKLWKKLFRYAYPLAIVVLAGMVNEVGDKIMLKHLLPESADEMTQLGEYGANFKLAVLMSIFIQMFRFAAEPFFFSHARENNSKNIYAAVMKYFVLFGLLIFLGVTLFLDVVKYFIDERYHGGLDIVAIVLLAKLFQGIFYNLSIWYKLTDKTRYGAYIAIMGAVITIVLNVVLVPVYGYMGAAWGQFACFFSMMVVSYVVGRKHFKVEYPLISIGKYVVFALGIYFLSEILSIQNNVLSLLVNAVLFIGFFVVAFFSEKDRIQKFSA